MRAGVFVACCVLAPAPVDFPSADFSGVALSGAVFFFATVLVRVADVPFLPLAVRLADAGAFLEVFLLAAFFFEVVLPSAVFVVFAGAAFLAPVFVGAAFFVALPAVAAFFVTAFFVAVPAVAVFFFAFFFATCRVGAAFFFATCRVGPAFFFALAAVVFFAAFPLTTLEALVPEAFPVFDFLAFPAPPSVVLRLGWLRLAVFFGCAILHASSVVVGSFHRIQRRAEV